MNGIRDDSPYLNFIRKYHHIHKGGVICSEDNALIFGDNAPHIIMLVVDYKHGAIIQWRESTINNQDITSMKCRLHCHATNSYKKRRTRMNNEVIQAKGSLFIIVCWAGKRHSYTPPMKKRPSLFYKTSVH